MKYLVVVYIILMVLLYVQHLWISNDLVKIILITKFIKGVVFVLAFVPATVLVSCSIGYIVIFIKVAISTDILGIQDPGMPPFHVNYLEELHQVYIGLLGIAGYIGFVLIFANSKKIKENIKEKTETLCLLICGILALATTIARDGIDEWKWAFNFNDPLNMITLSPFIVSIVFIGIFSIDIYKHNTSAN